MLAHLPGIHPTRMGDATLHLFEQPGGKVDFSATMPVHCQRPMTHAAIRH